MHPTKLKMDPILVEVDLQKENEKQKQKLKKNHKQ